MKNVHLLPTDKPSKLFQILQFNFIFDNQNKYSEEYKKLHKYKNKNIYITSDEEIKEGDGYIYLGQINKRIRKNTSAEYPYPHYQKIILTTDKDLIKDGVQDIDDKFLEWLVKNPSCERVEVEIILLGKVEGTTMSVSKYKIIIPKEEPKQALDMHEKQIKDAYKHGQNNGYEYRDGGVNIISAETYYEQTFKK